MEKKKINQVSSQVMELKELISGPLIATIDADSISSRRYLDYLFELAFESYDRKTGKVGEMRCLTFTYKSQDVSGSRKQKVSIPLLTLVPLPLLQVKEADFDFDINIIDAVTEDRNASFSFHKIDEAQTEDATSKFDDDGMKLRVSLVPNSGQSHSKLEQGLTANMKVSVKMRQADMPGGLVNLLGLTTNNLSSEVVDENVDAIDRNEDPHKTTE